MATYVDVFVIPMLTRLPRRTADAHHPHRHARLSVKMPASLTRLADLKERPSGTDDHRAEQLRIVALQHQGAARPPSCFRTHPPGAPRLSSGLPATRTR